MYEPREGIKSVHRDGKKNNMVNQRLVICRQYKWWNTTSARATGNTINLDGAQDILMAMTQEPKLEVPTIYKAYF